MDSRIKKAKELEALESLAKSAVTTEATLKEILARLDALDAKLTPPVAKGGR